MVERRRLTVRAAEAVRLIRSGSNDQDLMRAYNISARSVERLCEKLVQAGEIARDELERRMSTPQRSHVVDVVATPAQKHWLTKRKVQVSASEFVAFLRGGLSDLELMEKYGISSRGLDRLFELLVRRGHIAQTELDERKRSFQWADIAFVRSDGVLPEPIVESETRPLPAGERFREWATSHQVALAAALGLLGGVALSFAFLVARVGTDRTVELLWSPDHYVAAARSADPLTRAADQMVTILEAVARGEPGPKGSTHGEEQTKYDQCLKECDRDHPPDDEVDRVMRIACRKKCVLLYSERMRRVRELYHSPGATQ
jgi:hypothetical protein